jgi:hypothetical protein
MDVVGNVKKLVMYKSGLMGAQMTVQPTKYLYIIYLTIHKTLLATTTRQIKILFDTLANFVMIW